MTRDNPSLNNAFASASGGYGYFVLKIEDADILPESSPWNSLDNVTAVNFNIQYTLPGPPQVVGNISINPVFRPGYNVLTPTPEFLDGKYKVDIVMDQAQTFNVFFGIELDVVGLPSPANVTDFLQRSNGLIHVLSDTGNVSATNIVMIPAGTTSKTVYVQILDDLVAEPNENFFLKFSTDNVGGAAGASLLVPGAIAGPGDANLDGVFDSSDFVKAFQGGRYENGPPATWEQGDWNGDNQFDTSDFVEAFSAGWYEQ